MWGLGAVKRRPTAANTKNEVARPAFPREANVQFLFPLWSMTQPSIPAHANPARLRLCPLLHWDYGGNALHAWVGRNPQAIRLSFDKGTAWLKITRRRWELAWGGFHRECACSPRWDRKGYWETGRKGQWAAMIATAAVSCSSRWMSQGFKDFF